MSQKILVVDDAKFSRFMITKMISEIGCEILEAENGQDALEKIITEKPDLVLTDLLMPVMSGIDLLTLLKEKNIDIPTVVITSNIQESVQRQCKELGAYGFINKPPKKDILLGLIQKILNL